MRRLVSEPQTRGHPARDALDHVQPPRATCLPTGPAHPAFPKAYQRPPRHDERRDAAGPARLRRAFQRLGRPGRQQGVTSTAVPESTSSQATSSGQKRLPHRPSAQLGTALACTRYGRATTRVRPACLVEKCPRGENRSYRTPPTDLDRRHFFDDRG